MKIYLETVSDGEWRAALDAEIAQHDTAEGRFGLMLGAMVGTEDMANMLDTLEYEEDIVEREYRHQGW